MEAAGGAETVAVLVVEQGEKSEFFRAFFVFAGGDEAVQMFDERGEIGVRVVAFFAGEFAGERVFDVKRGDEAEYEIEFFSGEQAVLAVYDDYSFEAFVAGFAGECVSDCGEFFPG